MESPDLDRGLTPAAEGSSATSDAPQAPERWVWLARIRRPQGRKGEVLAEILTDFPDRFADRKQLWLLPEEGAGRQARHAAGSTAGAPADSSFPLAVQLKAHWLHKGGIVLHFEGIDSISDAERIAGLLVAIPHQQRAQLGQDEFYIADLAGCVVVDVAQSQAPVVVGEIQDVERETGSAPILIVRGTRSEVLIPFAKEYLRRIDLEAKRVEMALPEGLVDLNTGN